MTGAQVPAVGYSRVGGNVELVKHRRVLGKPVQVRSSNPAVAIASQVVSSEGVIHNEYDIHFLPLGSVRLSQLYHRNHLRETRGIDNQVPWMYY